MAAEYFIKRGERIVGPASLAQIKDNIAKGNIFASDEISRQEDGPWHRLGSVPDLISLFPDQPLVLPMEQEDQPEPVAESILPPPVSSSSNPSGTPFIPDAEQNHLIPDSTGTEEPNRLVTCVDCGKQISPRAQSCPQCGAPNPSNQKTTIVIDRKKGFYAMALAVKVVVDGITVGKVKNGRKCFVREVAPGRHELEFAITGACTEKVPINLHPGRKTIIEIKVGGGRNWILSIREE